MLDMVSTYPELIKKRNGAPVPFDVKKIREAIRKANDAAQVEAECDELLAYVPRAQAVADQVMSGIRQ